MSQNCTLAFVLDRVEMRYGRMTDELFSRLTADINARVDRLCRRWNFWFLRLPPGQIVVNNFPFASTTAVEALLYRTDVRWADIGWLVTRADQDAYMCWTANDTILDDTNDDVPVESRFGFSPVEIKQIRWCKHYNIEGTPRGTIDVLNHDDFTNIASYSQSAVPTSCTFVTENGISSILLSPRPNGVYLLQVAVDLATLPPLDRPHSTHAFLMHYPEAVINEGLICAAQFFGEQPWLEDVRIEQYGRAYLEAGQPYNMTPGGQIGAIIAETQSRHRSQHNTMRQYTSSREAYLRGGGRRRVIYGGYYADPLT